MSPPKIFGRALATPLLATLALGLALACGWSCVPATSAASGWSLEKQPRRWSPKPFEDEYNLGLASAGGKLWLATNGLNPGNGVRLAVYRYAHGSWAALPGRPRTTTDTGPRIVALPPSAGGPEACVGDTPPGGLARVRCFDGRRWIQQAIPRSLSRGLLVDMQVLNGQAVALFLDGKRHSHPFGFTTTIRIATLERGRFVASAPPLRIGKQALGNLVEPTTGTARSAPEVGITLTSDPTARWVASLRGNRWRRSRPLPADLVGGSMTSGPVRSRSALFFPVSQTDFPTTRPFEASIFRRRGAGDWHEVAGRPLNTGLGSAQTGVFAVGKRVWAAWTENDFEDAKFGGMIKTGVFAARIDQRGTGYDRTLTLWRGKTVFPEGPQVVAFQGQPVFAYMRQRSKRGGMHATVELGAE